MTARDLISCARQLGGSRRADASDLPRAQVLLLELADALEAAQREPIGYQVLAKRKTGQIVPRYTTAGGIWDEREPVDNHRAYCEDSAAADPERFGDDVEYVVVELRGVGE